MSRIPDTLKSLQMTQAEWERFEGTCTAGAEPRSESDRLCDVHVTDGTCAERIASALLHGSRNTIGNSRYFPLVINVGATSSTGDSVGPFVGWFLKRKGFAGEYLGDLKEPVHATNLKEKVNEAWMRAMKRDKFPYIVAVDSAIGRPGRITVNEGALKPGAGLNKQLPNVGNLHVMAGISPFPFMLWFSDLEQTVSMAETIADGLIEFQRHWDLTQQERQGR